MGEGQKTERISMMAKSRLNYFCSSIPTKNNCSIMCSNASKTDQSNEYFWGFNILERRMVPKENSDLFLPTKYLLKWKYILRD